MAQVQEALSPALPFPLPVANGRAQPKDRAGFKTHKRADHQTAQTSYHTGTVQRVGKTHFLLGQHPHSHLYVGEENKKNQTQPG